VIIPTAPTSNPNAPPSIPSSSTNAYLSAPKRVFTRVATAPASYNTTKTLTRSKTAAAGGLLFGQASKLASRVTDTSPRNGTIHLYLAVNHIKALPRELFSVKSLAVLSLRKSSKLGTSNVNRTSNMHPIRIEQSYISSAFDIRTIKPPRIECGQQ
jgi:hypothetical protein